MKKERYKKILEAIAGTVVGAIASVILIGQGLLIFSPYTRIFIIAGGMFGLLVGTVTALMFSVGSWLQLPWKARIAAVITVVAVGVAGTSCATSFNELVSGGNVYSGMGWDLALLAFGAFAAMFFISTSLATLLELVSLESSMGNDKSGGE